MKRTARILLGLSLAAAMLAGCAGAATAQAISVIAREPGSGTRGAFVELFGIEQVSDAGEKVDLTTDEAMVQSATFVVMTTVAGDPAAIGYISLGSLNDAVRAVEIDGTAATAENIKNGSYKIARPFNIATLDTVSETARDFIAYILSADGQAVVEANGYISSGASGAYTAAGSGGGEIVVAGSSSVTPVMEKLKEAYILLNPKVKIEIQQSDSTTGMTSAIAGICDIGMASRDIEPSELEQGLTGTVIATDGIAVIMNNDGPVRALTSQNVRDIFTGAVTDWAEIS